MLALSFTFPAGRYHATPWDRHVNEGAVAWPPEPWRILRALIAAWHHKIKPCGKYTKVTLLALIESLAKECPEYALPAASHSHTRHYMPQFKIDDTSLVFDAFIAVNKNNPLTVIWPHVELPADQMELLDDLLAVLGYLGRAESWVEAKRVAEAEAPRINCKPGVEASDAGTDEVRGEAVTLFVPLQKDEYRIFRERFLAEKKVTKKLSDTLPDNLLDALSIDTADLRKQGWNQPPAARKVSYLRPVHALRTVRAISKVSPTLATTAQFALAGKPLPRVEDSLRIGELLRLAIMSLAGKHFGEGNIPSSFSGHGLPKDNRHGHAFYLPWDSDGDGYIDRLILQVPLGITIEQRRMVEKLNRIWRRDGDEWQLVLENIDNNISMLCVPSARWQSITPYMHPWHSKKNFGIKEQISRECRERGLPVPVMLEHFESITINGLERKPIHFHRVRSKRGLTQPDTHGSFWKLTFPKPIPGPLALGFGCHYGLGLFKPDKSQ